MQQPVTTGVDGTAYSATFSGLGDSLQGWVDGGDNKGLAFVQTGAGGVAALSWVNTANVKLTIDAEIPRAPVTWDGGASGLWDTAANWDSDTVPVSGDTVNINNAAVSLTYGALYYPGIVNLTGTASLDVSGGNVARFQNNTIFNIGSQANFGASDDFFELRGKELNFDSGATADLGTWEFKVNPVTVQFNLDAAGFTTIDTGRLKPEMALNNFTWVVDMANYTGGEQTITLLDFDTNNGNAYDMSAAGFQTGTLSILNSGAFDECSLAWNESTLAVELTIAANEPPVVLADPVSATASSITGGPVANLYDGTVTADDIGTTDNQGGQFWGFDVGPHYVVYDMGSTVTFNAILYAQRDLGAIVEQIRFFVSDTDPGDATDFTIQSGSGYCELEVTNDSDLNLTEYELGGSLSGRYVVMQLSGADKFGGGYELVLASDPDAPADPLPAAPDVLADPVNATASSNYNNAPWTSATNLYDGTVTAADIGTTENQGGQYAGWLDGPHHVVYDMGSTVTFNAILYAQRDPGAAAEQINFWVTDTDPGHATNLTFQSGGVYAELDVTNVSDANLTAYELGGSLSGRYVVMKLSGSDLNAGGMELVLANMADAPADPFLPLPILPSIIWENDMSTDPISAPEPNWEVRGTDDNYTMDGGLLKLLAGDDTLLDTLPIDHFEGITILDLEWRATSVTTADPEASVGAGIWANVNHDAPSYGAVHFDAHLLGDGTQTVVIHHGWIDPQVTLTGFGSGMLTLHAEIDAELGMYTYTVTDGTLTQSGTVGYDEFTTPENDGSSFTLFALNGQSAEVDSVRIEANVVSTSQLYAQWAATYDLTGDDALPGADVEYGGLGDGYDNLMEYVLGGDPTVDDASSIAPATFTAADSGTNWFYQVHEERADDPTLTITYGTETDLVNAPVWDANDVEFVGESATIDSYKTVTNRTEAAASSKFIKMEVER
jgi:hypothetical protein